MAEADSLPEGYEYCNCHSETCNHTDGIRYTGAKTKKMGDKEYILCAAVWFNDDKTYEHQPRNIKTGIVVCGRRHHNCFLTAFSLNGEERIQTDVREGKRKVIQGFITDADRFVDRKEGAQIAFDAGQILSETKALASEDLY